MVRANTVSTWPAAAGNAMAIDGDAADNDNQNGGIMLAVNPVRRADVHQ